MIEFGLVVLCLFLAIPTLGLVLAIMYEKNAHKEQMAEIESAERFREKVLKHKKEQAQEDRLDKNPFIQRSRKERREERHKQYSALMARAHEIELETKDGWYHAARDLRKRASEVLLSGDY